MSAFTQAFTNSVFGAVSDLGVNSTETLLTNGSTFTGQREAPAFNEVFVTVIADQSGILFLDFFDNETDVETIPTAGIPIAANNYTEIHRFKARRGFRVRFLNDSGVNQTSFRLYTYFGEFDTFRQAQTGDVATLSAAGGITVGTAASVTLLSANADRKFINITVRDADIWLKLQPAATDNDEKGIYVPKETTYEFPGGFMYLGEISAISISTAAVYTTEV